MANGTLLASPTYVPAYIPFKIWKTNVTNETLCHLESTLEPPTLPTMNAAKMKDVRELYKCIDQESVDWMENLFESLTPEEVLPEAIEHVSDEEPVD